MEKIIRFIQAQPVAVRGLVGAVLAFLVASGVIDVGLSGELEALVGSVLAFAAFLSTWGSVEPLALQEARLAGAEEAALERDDVGTD